MFRLRNVCEMVKVLAFALVIGVACGYALGWARWLWGPI